MVQIIPRPESSQDRFAKAFGNLAGNLSQAIPQELMGSRQREQLGSIIGKDVNDIRDPDFLKLILQNTMQHELSQQAKAAETAQKMKFAEEIMNDPSLEGLNPTMKRMLALEAAGISTGGATKSIINALREKSGEEAFSGMFQNLFQNQGSKEVPGQDLGINSAMGEVGQEPPTIPIRSQQPQKPKRDFDSEISKWQQMLGVAESPKQKSFVESQIKELQNLREIQNRSEIAEKKDVSSSYEENKDYINKTYDQFEDSLRREAILDRLNQLDESGELTESGTINLLEQLGLKQEWLKNPKNEEYTKLSLDLLGGGTLQADYGSRVLASEFKVSQQRIPTLLQTKEGRRQIAENIRAMLLPSKLKNERLQFYLDRQERTGEPLPHNLRGKILNDIKPKLEEAYDKFKQRNGRYKVKDGTYPDDNALEKYFYLSDGNEKQAMRMMEEDGYDIKS